MFCRTWRLKIFALNCKAHSLPFVVIGNTTTNGTR
nr:MAG TPA: hypothetical protein [Caudoviricetes sp.]